MQGFRIVIARPQRGRGALSAKREEVPLGCNLGKALTLIAPAIVGERTAGPGDALTVRTSHRQNGKRFRLVIARPRRGRGNLGKAVTISPIVFLESGSVLRDCHVASLLAMTRQGSAVVHQRSPAVELPYTRRSLSAATDAIGFHVLSPALYELQVPSRDCHVGLRSPRNDKSEAFAILTVACTDCKCVAGPGCPLPYNGGYHETAACFLRRCCAGRGKPLPYNASSMPRPCEITCVHPASAG